MALDSREKEMQSLRSKLLLHKQLLIAEAEATLTTMPDTSMFSDLGDQASAEIDRNYVLRLRGREQKLIKKIEKALDKMESGTYGLCESCGAEIEFKRLDARPVTTLCIDCKIEQEEEEKMREE
ncbi:RNA polymerase-binding, DksA [Candidatus Magnetobacterium bavaricum]|uniref:RNA polymerase-binding, DksA n=1 Tax=Candidatus Magnetobacterium bavaricum TaxID=29290 RepID=A0A0F3GNM6_9BACT|nr:RNA polymerase-binding, DksA [Candidatus Magnetobacterium bavaricum]